MNLSSLSLAKFTLLLSLLFLPVTLFTPVSGIAYVTAFLAAVLLLFSFWLLVRSEKEVARMIDVCRKIKHGDFETRLISIREKGNLGELEWAINEMVDVMDAYVRESRAAMEFVSRNRYFRRILGGGLRGSLLTSAQTINRATDHVEDKMNSFSNVADDLNATLAAIVTKIETTSTNLDHAVSQMQQAVQHSRKEADSASVSSTETSHNVQAISAASEEMSSSVAEITQQMTRTSVIAREAVTDALQATEHMNKLAEMAVRIGEVVGMITTIAEQTNLLALNATIEAARAGEAGKGFAVVASEVKELSNQTAAATENISALISTLQGVTQNAVQAVTNVHHVIGKIDEASSVVAAAIEEQSAASQEIAVNAAKASSGTDYVADNVASITHSIGEVDGASFEVSGIKDVISNEIARDIVMLRGKMESFMEELKKIA